MWGAFAFGVKVKGKSIFELWVISAPPSFIATKLFLLSRAEQSSRVSRTDQKLALLRNSVHSGPY